MSGFTPEQIAADRASIEWKRRVGSANFHDLTRWSAALDEVERLTVLLDIEQHTQQANEDMGREIVRQRSEIERLSRPDLRTVLAYDLGIADGERERDARVPIPDREVLAAVMVKADWAVSEAAVDAAYACLRGEKTT